MISRSLLPVPRDLSYLATPTTPKAKPLCVICGREIPDREGYFKVYGKPGAKQCFSCHDTYQAESPAGTLRS